MKAPVFFSPFGSCLEDSILRHLGPTRHFPWARMLKAVKINSKRSHILPEDPWSCSCYLIDARSRLDQGSECPRWCDSECVDRRPLARFFDKNTCNRCQKLGCRAGRDSQAAGHHDVTVTHNITLTIYALREELSSPGPNFSSRWAGPVRGISWLNYRLLIRWISGCSPKFCMGTSTNISGSTCWSRLSMSSWKFTVLLSVFMYHMVWKGEQFAEDDAQRKRTEVLLPLYIGLGFPGYPQRPNTHGHFPSIRDGAATSLDISRCLPSPHLWLSSHPSE